MTSSDERTTRPVRMLGTTWAERGPRYWLRRIGLSAIPGAMALCVVTVYVGLAVGLTTAARNPLPQFLIGVAFVVGAVWSTWSALNAYWPVVRAERDRDVTALRAIVEHRASGASRRGALAGAGVGLGALAGSPIAAGLLSFGAVFIVGWPVVMFAMSLRRYSSAEECLAVLESTQRDRRR